MNAHSGIAAANAARLIRLKPVLEMTGLGKTSIYKLMGNGEFPRCYRITKRAVGWRFDEVQGWIANRSLAA